MPSLDQFAERIIYITLPKPTVLTITSLSRSLSVLGHLQIRRLPVRKLTASARGNCYCNRRVVFIKLHVDLDVAQLRSR